MFVEEAIKKRRSIRKYKDKPISLDYIKKIIEAATFAPSADNGQTWRFTVLTGDEKNKITDIIEKGLDQLAVKFGENSIGSSKNSCNILMSAPALIFVWNKGSDYSEPRIKESIEQFKSFFSDPNRVMSMVELQGVSAAIQNMLLMAYSMGLGSLWINDVYYVKGELEDYFGNGWDLIAVVTLGYPDVSELNKAPPKRLSVEMVTDFR